MISYKITDIKAFTSALFVKEVFDRFLVCEATIQTSNTFHIDGNLQLDYFNDVEKEEYSIIEINDNPGYSINEWPYEGEGQKIGIAILKLLNLLPEKTCKAEK